MGDDESKLGANLPAPTSPAAGDRRCAKLCQGIVGGFETLVHCYRVPFRQMLPPSCVRSR